MANVSETPKKFSHIFSNFWPIFRLLPPLLALSQKVSCETFQNYSISMYNSNTDLLGLILDVEVFFLWVTVQEHCVSSILVISVSGIIQGNQS